MVQDIKELILEQLSKKEKIKVADVVKATGFSRAYVNRFFQELREEGIIALIGKANKAHYVLASKADKAKRNILSVRRILKNINLSESSVLEQIKENSGIFSNLTKNVESIIDYGFTKMLNNAIEHSKSKKIVVSMNRKEGKVEFEVVDFGIGIFNNIMRKKKLKNKMEAIQDLLKGKQTTAPKEHTGEGIFFTSKVADKLIIQGSDKKIIFDNIRDDVFIRDASEIEGTRVVFEISLGSKRKLDSIFREYSEGSFEFGKTKVVVNLYEMDNSYISRSQARRILAGLEKFKIIVLDFKNVETVGQGFADEVFRVWQNRHPTIEIRYQEVNENVLFMIKRAKGG
jgi:hypothetical protein